MKLNATTEMMPVTWPEFSRLHPFAPREQAPATSEIFRELEAMLAEITGFAGVSLQPNAGSQGEYAGLLVIQRLPPSARRGPPQRLPDPAVGARHQPGLGGDGGLPVVVVEDATRTATSTSRDLEAQGARSTRTSSPR